MAFPRAVLEPAGLRIPASAALLDAHAPGGPPLSMSIGEPRHEMPDFVTDVLNAHLPLLGKYPSNDGIPPLLDAITAWIARRYGVQLDHDNLMVLNGTREGLFNAALALCPETKNGARPLILTPNPFYQVYAVAAAAVGAEPVFVPATAENGYLPDYASLPAATLDRVALAYLCTPSNPQGPWPVRTTCAP